MAIAREEVEGSCPSEFVTCRIRHRHGLKDKHHHLENQFLVA